MLKSTIEKLRCPVPVSSPVFSEETDGSSESSLPQLCQGELELLGKSVSAPSYAQEIVSGTLGCRSCQSSFPILAGVAILANDVGSYILHHVKGIAQLVSDEEIPIEYREDFLEAKSQIESEHIEEDLEAERVVSLYLMNHYLRVGDSSQKLPEWLKPEAGTGSPLIQSLIREHWDRGPFWQIQQWMGKRSAPASASLQAQDQEARFSLIEIGSGVGGVLPLLRSSLSRYLGVDSSFASVALARHLALGGPYPRKLRIPGDLLQGAVSREVGIQPLGSLGDPNVAADFVVGEIESFPVQKSAWDVTIALNAIDMMPEPAMLPKIQHELLKVSGVAIQSCPYIWHEQVARELRQVLPKQIRDSAQAVEWLYQQAGFQMQERVEHLPWLFFKHLRQLEIYSVHIFCAKKILLEPG
jgi:SAM-dependent methyltransferase